MRCRPDLGSEIQPWIGLVSLAQQDIQFIGELEQAIRSKDFYRVFDYAVRVFGHRGSLPMHPALDGARCRDSLTLMNSPIQPPQKLRGDEDQDVY